MQEQSTKDVHTNWSIRADICAWNALNIPGSAVVRLSLMSAWNRLEMNSWISFFSWPVIVAVDMAVDKYATQLQTLIHTIQRPAGIPLPHAQFFIFSFCLSLMDFNGNFYIFSPRFTPRPRGVSKFSSELRKSGKSSWVIVRVASGGPRSSALYISVPYAQVCLSLAVWQQRT
jgi:hypothetical protein